jgi:hypothetical protein
MDGQCSKSRTQSILHYIAPIIANASGLTDSKSKLVENAGTSKRGSHAPSCGTGTRTSKVCDLLSKHSLVFAQSFPDHREQ